MCGIIGIVSQTTVNEALVSILKGLQHRGQHAAGVATMDGDFMHLKKDLGFVKDVVTEYDMTYLRGNAGIGHVRYPTSGVANDPEQAHPFYINSPFGIMLAHNGNLTNSRYLRDNFLKKNHRHVRTQSDSEILTNVFAFELEQLTAHQSLDNTKIFAAITNVHKRISGGYAVVSLIANYGLVAFRDPYGIRPLTIGKKEENNSTTHLISSESCAIDINNFEFIRDILPGEAVIITLDGKVETKICHPNPSLNICIFEYVYLSRPDSIMEHVPIQLARRLMGRYLAQTIREKNLEIDAIIPIPDTSRIVAVEVAETLKLPYREGFVKNHFTGRTFMLANQEQRKIAVRNKLSPIALEFKDKNILLIDDSIVRGNTSKELISIIRNYGAKNVYLASAAPQVRHPNVYGIDMPTRNELIAHNRTDEEIAKLIGADLVIFQTLENLKRSITDINPKLTNFEASCFDGKYITGDVSEEYLNTLFSMN